MPGAAAPTPGRITWLAARMRAGSSVSGSVGTEPLERELQRREIRAARRDDDRVRLHSWPFVVGSSSPCRLNAWRSERATALKRHLDHVVRVLAAHADVNRGAERLRERTEEMRHELRRQVADAIARELRFEHEERPPAEIDRHLGVRFVHRQQEAVALDAAFVAERLAQRLAERQRDVLDRVVLVDVQIARALHVELEAAVLAELLEHVIEEAETGLRARLGFAVEIDGDANVGLARAPLHGRGARPIDERVRDRLPGLGARATRA